MRVLLLLLLLLLAFGDSSGPNGATCFRGFQWPHLSVGLLLLLLLRLRLRRRRRLRLRLLGVMFNSLSIASSS